MRKCLVVVAMLLATSNSFASDLLNCEYAKADISKGVNSPMVLMGQGRVEFDGKSFKAYRPNGSYIFTPPLTTQRNGMIFLDDKTKVFAANIDKSNFAISDRITKTTEQWASCTALDGMQTEQEKADNEMKMVEKMDSARAKKYFMKEKHAFTTSCLVWNDVTMITGKFPAIIIADGVEIGRNAHWNGHEYSFTFNNGRMTARFNPSEKRHKFLIQAGDKFYGCGPSVIDHNFDKDE
ncbi:hypothetical protein [Brenneria uluponensis]|uniref:hypothetical protein n=1 Tax=Brenneria uluponensis TaxID=3057057 RepID=UPI0028E67D24|nr:hypothetical protein [Brenneria ulupoensis]